MVQYNPDAAVVMGPQWRPTVPTATQLAANSTVKGARFSSTITESIQFARLCFASVATPGRYVIEVYEQGDEECGTSTTNIYYPSADVSNDLGLAGGKWANELGTTATGTLYQSIDETLPVDAKWLIAQPGDYAARYSFNIDTSAFAARRPTEMRLVLQCRAFLPIVTPSSGLIGVGFTDGVTSYDWPPVSFAQVGLNETVLTFVLPTLNPFTLLPWTTDDIQDFASLKSFYFSDGTFSAASLLVDQVQLEIDSVPENRQAFGAGWVSAGGWNTFMMLDPGGFHGGTMWAKAAGIDYSFVLRRITDATYGAVGSLAWACLEGDVCPVSDHIGVEWTADASGCLVPGTIVETPLRAMALALITNLAVTSIDSQVYATLDAPRVDTANDAEQEYSNADVADYGRITALVQRGSVTTADLTVKIKKRSDSSQVGSTVTLTVAEFDALPDSGNGWKVLDKYLSTPASLPFGVGQVYVEFTSLAGTGDSDGWLVGCFDTLSLPDDSKTFGGTTDRATILGAESSDRDLAATIAELPDPVDGFAAVLASWAVPDDGTRSTPVAADYAQLTWTPTALADDFGWYIIERSEDSGSTWTTIARITTEAVDQFRDFEGLRLVCSMYRISVARLDGTLSVPAEADDCVEPMASACSYVFTTNEAPELTLALDGGPTRSFQFSDGDKVVLRDVYGRDYPLAFKPSEKGGDRFTLALRVSFKQEPATPGRAMFDPVNDLAAAAVSYVCVHDQYGRRWLSLFNPRRGDQAEPQHSYVATVDIAQAASRFSTPDVSLP